MADTVVKVTKVEYFTMIKDVVLGAGVDNADELVAFLDKQIEMVENKAAKAKEKAAEKKAETDALKQAVLDNLTDEYQTAEAIVAAIDDAEVTKAKVVSRLSALVKDGKAEKEQSTVEGKKVMTYRAC